MQSYILTADGRRVMPTLAPLMPDDRLFLEDGTTREARVIGGRLFWVPQGFCTS